MNDRRQAERRDLKKRPEILPCPFHEKDKLPVIGNIGEDKSVTCDSCNAWGPREQSREQAVFSWNKRHLFEAEREAAPRKLHHGQDFLKGVRMMKFKPGDRVKHLWENDCLGTVKKMDGDGYVFIDWDDGQHCTLSFSTNEIVIATK